MSSRSLLPVIGCVFAAQLLTAIVVVPPWQNPDEPQHVITVQYVLDRGPDFDVEATWGDDRERAIVASMARYGWWRHYGQRTPDPPPPTFATGPALVVGDYVGPPSGGSRLYYRGVAALLGAAGIDGLLPQMYAMRALAAGAGLLTLWCIWSGALVLLDSRAAAAITAFASLHPQFVLVSATASPDALVNLAGSVVWRQAAVLLSSGISLSALALLWTAGVGGFLIRRMGAPILLVAAAVTLVACWRHPGIRRHWYIGLGAGIAAALLYVVVTLGDSEVARAIRWSQFDVSKSIATIVADAPRLPAFLGMLFTTFWLAAGWLKYTAPPWWQLATAVLAVVGAAGLIRIVASERGRSDAVWLGVMMVLLQLAAVVAYYFGIRQAGPQGRYLFPVLPAMLALMWLGWNAWFTSGRRPHLAAASLVALAATLNTLAWVLVVLPAYA